MLILLCLSVLVLAYANGANDNFKGVATLFGSGAANYRRALAWATGTTLLGSLTAVYLAEKLLRAFSGKGLVGDHLPADATYATAVALGAALTVLLATRIGMPVSTTHGLVGALVGAGWAAGSDIDLNKLGGGFFLPLLLSPVVALGATVVCYPLFRYFRRRSGVTEETCFYVCSETVGVVPVLGPAAAIRRVEQLTVQVGDVVTSRNRYQGRMLGVEAAAILDRVHYLSAGVVSFARGLNDTPKIAALLLLVSQFGGWGGPASVGLLMAVGGVVSARRVAETMSHKITPMSHGQGFTANLITGIIVIVASRLGVPVSTTHVSCGSLFGIGTVTGQADVNVIGKIVTAWVTTLPVGAFLGACCYWLVGSI